MPDNNMISPFWQNQDTRRPLPSTGNRDEDYIRDWAVESYNWSVQAHERDWCEDNYIYYKYFKNFVEYRIDPDDYHANIGIGLVFPMVKTLGARLMSPWMNGDRLIDAVAMEAIGKNIAPNVAGLINHHWVNVVPNMFSKMELVVESALAFGRGILKPVVRWYPPHTRMQRVLRTLNDMMGRPMPVGTRLIMQQVPVTKKLTYEYVDPFNFWWVGSTRWTADCDYTCERSYVTYGEAVRRMDSGEWTAHEISPGQAMGYDQHTQRRLQLEGGTGDNVRAGDMGAKPHSVWEMQGWVETRKRNGGNPVFEQRIIQILDGQYLVKNKPLATWNGRPEYIVFTPVNDPAGERPIGLVEVVEQMVLVCNDLVNIAYDNARKVIESPLMIDPRSTDQTELFIGPADHNWVRDPSRAVAPVPMKDLPESYYRMVTFFMDLVQKNAGVNSDAGAGLNTSEMQRLTPGLKTARGFNQMMQTQSDRFSPITRKMDIELYRPAAKWFHETAKLRMEEPEKLVLSGVNTESPFVEVKPSDLENAMKFTFNAKALDATNNNRRAEFIDMMRLLAEMAQYQAPGPMGYQIDLNEAARIAMDLFDRDADADQLVISFQQLMGAAPASPGGPFATPSNPNPTPGTAVPAQGPPSQIPNQPPSRRAA